MKTYLSFVCLLSFVLIGCAGKKVHSFGYNDYREAENSFEARVRGSRLVVSDLERTYVKNFVRSFSNLNYLYINYESKSFMIWLLSKSDVAAINFVQALLKDIPTINRVRPEVSPILFKLIQVAGQRSLIASQVLFHYLPKFSLPYMQDLIKSSLLSHCTGPCFKKELEFQQRFQLISSAP